MNSAKELFDEAYVKGTMMLFMAKPLNNDKEYKRRLKICNACPNLNSLGKCKLCKCAMRIKANTLTHHNIKKLYRTEITHCPAGKWDDLEIANHYREIDGLELLT